MARNDAEKEAVIVASISELLSACPLNFDFPMGGAIEIPMDLEAMVIDAAKGSAALSLESACVLRNRLNQHNAYTLAIFSVRMAVHAVRTKAPEVLQTAIFGLLIDERFVDWRDFLGAISIIDNCANRLGVDLRQWTEKFEYLLSEPRRKSLFDGYFSRSAEMRTVEIMGFKAIESEHGLSFACR